MCQLVFRARDCFRVVASAAERLLPSPVSTVDCKKGFNGQNIIKTDLRNRMSPASLDKLIRLSTTRDDISYDAAFSIWANAKNRRILG